VAYVSIVANAIEMGVVVNATLKPPTTLAGKVFFS
jgi:hypothetical protein